MTTIEKLITIGLTGLLAYSVFRNSELDQELDDMENELIRTQDLYWNIDAKLQNLAYQSNSTLHYADAKGGRLEAKITSEIVVDTLDLYEDAKIEVANETEE